MENKLSVLIDLNVILDVLQKREPFFSSSAGLLALAETDQIHGCVAAHSFATLFYLIQKDKSTAEAKSIIANLLQFVKVSRVDQDTIKQALALDYRDFEDAIQMVCALQCKADYLITRNIKDYQPALVPVIEPVNFLSVY